MTNINDLQEQFENLMKQGQELLEKMKENHIADVSKKVRWEPKKNEKYFYITPNFKLKAEYFEEQFDEECWSVGNCFKTEQEAQKELDRRLAEQELFDLADYDEKEREGWIIVFDFDLKFVPSNFSHRYACFPRFATEESAQNAIKQLGTEKLKLIFRIED